MGDVPGVRQPSRTPIALGVAVVVEHHLAVGLAEGVEQPLRDAALLEAVEPLKVLAVPRAAVLTDQQGPYIYVVNDKNIAEQRRVKLGQSTAEVAGVTEGLKEGERVVTEGVQRVRPNQPVAPSPASPTRP